MSLVNRPEVPVLPDPRPRGRLVSWTLWCDGIFVMVLGVVLATVPVTGLLPVLSLPAPPRLVVGLGLLLLPVGAGLVYLSRRWNARLVRAVGIANVAGALLCATWLALRLASFATPGRLLVGATTFALALFATLELAPRIETDPA